MLHHATGVRKESAHVAARQRGPNPFSSPRISLVRPASCRRVRAGSASRRGTTGCTILRGRNANLSRAYQGLHVRRSLCARRNAGKVSLSAAPAVRRSRRVIPLQRVFKVALNGSMRKAPDEPRLVNRSGWRLRHHVWIQEAHASEMARQAGPALPIVPPLVK